MATSVTAEPMFDKGGNRIGEVQEWRAKQSVQVFVRLASPDFRAMGRKGFRRWAVSESLVSYFS